MGNRHIELGIEYIDRFLELLGIKGGFEFKMLDGNSGMKITIGGMDLADLGFGVTQILPVILKIVYLSVKNVGVDSDFKGFSFSDQNLEDFNFDQVGVNQFERYNFKPSTLILEEPEANLHPKLQSMLAKLFIYAHQELKVNLIIETHSEYLIRGLQVQRIENTDFKKEDCVIYYINNEEYDTNIERKVTKIFIEDNASLSENFGSGFLDEAARLIKTIWRHLNMN
jgi:predicted ATPase